MGFKEMDIQISYKSKGDNNITDTFLNPALRQSRLYRRCTGFFSSSVFELIADGVVSLVRNGGHIQLIVSPKLNEDDVNAINLGYEIKKEIVLKKFSDEFDAEIESLNDDNLQLLCELIVRNILDIRIAVTDANGMYHDKLGILTDFDGNDIVFYGSSNSSYSGYKNNYEKIRVVKGWIPGNLEIIFDEVNEFDDLWNGNNSFVEVYDFPETSKKHLLEVLSFRTSAKKSSGTVTLRDYQEKAILAWKENNYHGFYVMATGTGKTWTAIYSAKELVKTHKAMIVICAPYKHLVKQWAEDVEKAFPDAKIILVSSENAGWDKQISIEVVRNRYNQNSQIIIISTISSFNMQRFDAAIKKSNSEKLLIVDEAHRFTQRPEILKKQYKYMLGLSATPYSGTSAKKGQELMDFFGGQVFSLTIEEALERGFLVPYYYVPIFVNATEEEERRFAYQSMKIASCFKNGVCINPDQLVLSLRSRLRIISMAEEKYSLIDMILNHVKEKDHFVVYCGDGRLFDNKTGEELRHIQAIKKVLTGHEYKASQFTATENMNERMELVDAFNKGEISALAAIRCLDEGINIPSIKSALILSSNDDYREFVQRRGRILRTYPNKENAIIYDVVVLPSGEQPQWAKIELRRYLEYGHLAVNWDELEIKMNDLLNQYDLSIDDIDVFDYDDMEGDEQDE